MLIRLAFLGAVVVGLGILMGTFDRKTVTSVTSRIPRPQTILRDEETEYRDTVESDFRRLRPLDDAFLSGCGPEPAVAGICSTMSQQMLGALRSLQIDLRNLSVPESFQLAHATLRRGVAKGLQGFAQVQRAVRTRRRADWLRARDLLKASDILVNRAYDQLPARERPQIWGY